MGEIKYKLTIFKLLLVKLYHKMHVNSFQTSLSTNVGNNRYVPNVIKIMNSPP